MSTEGHGPATPPGPGWYPDPSDARRARWWDGQRWTDQVRDRSDAPGTRAEPHATEAAVASATTVPAGHAAEEATASDPPEEPPASGPPRRGRRAVLVAVSTLVLLGGSVGLGVAIGWTLADERAARDGPAPADDAQDDPDVDLPDLQQDPAEARMPDLRGLDQEVALEVLSDAGVPPDRVTVEGRPWSGEAGLVVEQRPSFATADPEGVTLRVSEPAAVPDLIGQHRDDAIVELDDLGVVVRTEQRFADGADAGEVLGIDPEPGADLPPEVELEVAAPPASVFLASLSLVEGSCRVGEASVDGRTYADALTCGVGSQGAEHAWVLARSAGRLRGTFGVPDDGSTDAAVVVEVLVDGERRESVTVAYGQPAEVDVAVDGALRLTLRSSPAGEDEDGSAVPTDLVLADVRLVGAGDALDALRGDG